jgi:phenylpropionate dioxygenase-like ring-hydroxylating dioxygenase large terminal subunit
MVKQAEKKPLAEKFFSEDWSKDPEPKLGNQPILGDRYTSKEFMKLEWDKLWTKVWQVAGLEQQLSNPGDFFTFEFGSESILCAKGEDSKIRCFYNVCQHRGNQLVQVKEGNLESFDCAYHAWKFGLDGTLKWVPEKKTFSRDHLAEEGILLK